jgi:hypothetical protein
MTAFADDYISPDLIRITTPRYISNSTSFQPRLGTYEYTVGWEGIAAASCAVTIRRSGDTYVVDASARTYSAVDLLYKLRYEAVGTLSAHQLAPISFFVNQRENSRVKKTDVLFSRTSDEITAIRSKGDDDPDKKFISFSPHNGMLDPFAAVFIARSLPWEVGESRDFDVFNGKSRYFISLHALERTTIEFQGEQRKAIVISPYVRNLTTTRPTSKLREARIYVSDDTQREVLKISSSVFVGNVHVNLVSFVPATEPRAATSIARTGASDELRAQLR